MVTLGGVLALYATATVVLGTDIRRLPPGLVAGAPFEFLGLRVTTAQPMGRFMWPGAYSYAPDIAAIRKRGHSVDDMAMPHGAALWMRWAAR